MRVLPPVPDQDTREEFLDEFVYPDDRPALARRLTRPLLRTGLPSSRSLAVFHHHSHRDSPSSDMARAAIKRTRVTIKKISFDPTAEENPALWRAARPEQQAVSGASGQPTMVLGGPQPSNTELPRNPT
jgi:hypothetical protein